MDGSISQSRSIDRRDVVACESDALPRRVPKRRRWPKALGAMALCFLLACSGVAVVLADRHLHRTQAEADSRGMELVALDDPAEHDGPFETSIEYTSMASPADRTASVEIAWDDEWFFEDPAAYNHGLATACSALSALAYAESAHHQSGSNAPSYMEQALAQLGFDNATMQSYEYRSEVVDEVLDAVTQGSDVVAYTIATKEISSRDTGERKLLVLVAIRGSYGSEWLSDFNIYGAVDDGEAAETDHSGFQLAAREIVEELELLRDEHPDESLALLLTGHSRGGAAANLLAAYADDAALGGRPFAPLDSIYAYTFASPTVTTQSDAASELYDNIFNILNPSDAITRFPLASWGYARFGRDILLPSIDDEGFDDMHAAMEERFLAIVGAESLYDPSDVRAVDALEQKLSMQLETPEDAASIEGVWSIASGVLGDLDVARVLCGHLPSTYIAWLSATTADDLGVA